MESAAKSLETGDDSWTINSLRVGVRMPGPFDHPSGVTERQEQHDSAPGIAQSDLFRDLNLDQIFDAVTLGREEYDLRPFLEQPLDDSEAIYRRHDVFRDLAHKSIFDALTAFAEGMREARRRSAQARNHSHLLQRERWVLDAIDAYRRAVTSLVDRLTAESPRSQELVGFLSFAAGYTESTAFETIAEGSRRLEERLSAVTYAVHVKGNKVTVRRYAGEPDYSTEVIKTFEKFRQSETQSYLVEMSDPPEMNQVEAQILDRVARLFPDEFAELESFCAAHSDYIDPEIARFDREMQLYLAYSDQMRRLEAAGLSFCYPEIARDSELYAEDAFDLALANKLHDTGASIVSNDFRLSGPERILVVSGPNQGGKTTFARMFGQIHYLASLGLPVPGRRARLYLPDRIYSHFEREEELATLRSKLEDELVRISEILARATDRSVVIMNESFESTSLNDSRFIGTQVLGRLKQLGSLCVYVTFVDELASLNEATVSMVSSVVPDNPVERTYRIERREADGLAYASALAEKYGLSYQALKRRLSR